MFRALLCPSSGARDYTEVYSMWQMTHCVSWPLVWCGVAGCASGTHSQLGSTVGSRKSNGLILEKLETRIKNSRKIQFETLIKIRKSSHERGIAQHRAAHATVSQQLSAAGRFAHQHVHSPVISL